MNVVYQGARETDVYILLCIHKLCQKLSVMHPSAKGRTLGDLEHLFDHSWYIGVSHVNQIDGQYSCYFGAFF